MEAKLLPSGGPRPSPLPNTDQEDDWHSKPPTRSKDDLPTGPPGDVRNDTGPPPAWLGTGSAQTAESKPAE